MRSRFKPGGENRDPSQNKRMQMIEPHGCIAHVTYSIVTLDKINIAGLVAFKLDIVLAVAVGVA